MRGFRLWLASAIAVTALVIGGHALHAWYAKRNAVWLPSPAGAYLTARYAEVNGDIEKAAVYYAAALAADPDNTLLLRRTFTFAAIDGDLASAAVYARRLEALEPLPSLAQLLLVTDAVRDGHLRQAERRLGHMARQGINAFIVPIALAWVRYGEGDPEGAFATLEMMDTNGSFKALGQLHRALIEEAMGDREGAQRSYDRFLALADQPLQLRGLQLAAGFLAHNGQKTRALDLARAYAERFPDSLLLDNALRDIDGPRATPASNAREGLAELFYGAASFLAYDDYQGASLFNRMALYLRPDFPLSELLMGQLLLDQGRFEQADDFFRKVRRSEKSLALLAGLEEVKSLRERQRVDDAVTALRKIISRYPGRVLPRLELADTLRVEGRFEESAKAYTDAIGLIRRPSERHWVIYFGRGVCLERTGHWEAAEADFVHALELKPDQPLVLNYLGYSWVDRGVRLREARTLIERAVALRPKDGAIIDSLGWAHFRLGEYDQAVKVLEWAVREQPNDPTINDHLGDAYWMVGRTREAVFQWNRALALSADDDLSRTLRAKIAWGLTPSGEPASEPARDPGQEQGNEPVPPAERNTLNGHTEP
ncbi:tetratricopeptide repeat protein [Phaeovibrio sulfidiphilus]|uniref:Tetratricopeptide repeat protein n=1 Tax=Phaeovibrio sulfidiphilus TaxID=1220600 RepID=A0A8J6YL18_9PROT|nr:tetratricopeptide repeat protein [Phaeovibrio sulfidiphilus]MBE1236625.1 tetratricopeptide repeat protein [Phaeovibrio sulfidiphilus]